MAALKIKEGMEFDSTATYQHVKTYLPSYARPFFIRIQVSSAETGFRSIILFLYHAFLKIYELALLAGFSGSDWDL